MLNLSYYVDLHCGPDPAGRLVVQCRERIEGTPDDEATYTYDWWLAHGEAVHTNAPDQPLHHRHGDGPWALVADAIAAAEMSTSVKLL